MNVKTITYMKVNTTAKGIIKISEKEAAFKIFAAWNSTNEIRKRAPHHEFWPIIYKEKNKAHRNLSPKHIFPLNALRLTSNNFNE